MVKGRASPFQICLQYLDLLIVFAYGLLMFSLCTAALMHSFTFAFGVEISDNGAPSTPLFWPTSFLAELQAPAFDRHSLLRDVQRVSYSPFPKSIRVAVPNPSAIREETMSIAAKDAYAYTLLESMDYTPGGVSLVESARMVDAGATPAFTSRPVVCPYIEPLIVSYVAALERSYIFSAPLFKALVDPAPGTVCAAVNQQIRTTLATRPGLERVFELLYKTGTPNLTTPEWLLAPRNASVCLDTGNCPPIVRTSAMNSTYEPPVLTTQLVIASLIASANFFESDAISDALRDNATACLSLPPDSPPSASICDQIYGPMEQQTSPAPDYDAVDFIRDRFGSGLRASNALSPAANLPLCVPDTATAATASGAQSGAFSSSYGEQLTDVGAVQAQARTLCEAMHTWGLHDHVTVLLNNGRHRVINDPTTMIKQLTDAASNDLSGRVATSLYWVMALIAGVDPYDKWFVDSVNLLHSSPRQNASESYKPIEPARCDDRIRSVAYLWYVWGVAVTASLAVAASATYGLTLGLGAMLSVTIYALVAAWVLVRDCVREGSKLASLSADTQPPKTDTRIEMRRKPNDPLIWTTHGFGVFFTYALLEWLVQLLRSVDYARPVPEGRVYSKVTTPFGLGTLASASSDEGALWAYSRSLAETVVSTQYLLLLSWLTAVVTWGIRMPLNSTLKLSSLFPRSLPTKRTALRTMAIIIFGGGFFWLQILYGRLYQGVVLATLQNRLLAGRSGVNADADLCAPTTTTDDQRKYEQALGEYKEVFAVIVRYGWNVHAYFTYAGCFGGLFASQWAFVIPSVYQKPKTAAPGAVNNAKSGFNLDAFIQPAGFIYLFLTLLVLSTWIGVATQAMPPEGVSGVNNDLRDQLVNIFGGRGSPFYTCVAFVLVGVITLFLCVRRCFKKCQDSRAEEDERLAEIQRETAALPPPQKTRSRQDAFSGTRPLPSSGRPRASTTSQPERMPLLALMPHERL